MKATGVFALILSTAGLFACNPSSTQNKNTMTSIQDSSHLQTAILGAGCFWCVEAIFQDFKGVTQVESGYANGKDQKPTYKEVCTGTSGFAEVIKIQFDPQTITFEQILDIFWHAHNPTTLNRQGADIGTQYRSAVFYADDQQKATAVALKEKIEKSGLWEDPIVTIIEPLRNYYVAEAYHQNYFNENPDQGYCSVVIAPKVSKIRKAYASLLKE